MGSSREGRNSGLPSGRSREKDGQVRNCGLGYRGAVAKIRREPVIEKLDNDDFKDRPEANMTLANQAREILRDIGWSTTVHHVGMICAVLRKYEVTRK
jgi:hypothetical protein